MGRQVAARLSRRSNGGCGIYFDATGMQFVRLCRVAGGSQLRVEACGSVVLEDDMLKGAQIAKPEAVSRRLEEMLERSDLNAEALQNDTIVLALPSHGLKTQLIDFPSDLPSRAVRAWCERRAALLLPGDGDPDWRCRVGVTWADPGSRRLWLYACEASLVDDRLAVLEMAGLRADVVDDAHRAGRRAFLWARQAQRDTPMQTLAPGMHGASLPVGWLQIDTHDIDLAVFDGSTCVADVRERFDGAGAHPEVLASVVRDLWRDLCAGLHAVPRALHLVAPSVTPGELAVICDAIAARCEIAVHPFDPLDGLGYAEFSGARCQAVAQPTALAVPMGLALRAMAKGVA